MKKDFNILNYFNMRALFMGIGISKILTQSNEYIWISLLLGTLIGSFIIYFLKFKLKKNIINVIVASLLFIYGLFILLNLITTMYLTEMPRFMVGIPIILLILYILSKKEVIIYRVSNILIILNLILYFLATIALIPYFKLDNFMFTDTPLINVLKSSFEYAIFSVVPVLITKDEKTKDIPIIKTYIISSITMSIIFFLTYGILGPNLVSIYRYPEYIILKKISVMNFLENVENIISFMWIFDMFIFLLCNGRCIKDNLKYPKLIFLIIPILLLVTTLISKYYIIMISIYKYSSLIILSLGIILLFFNKKSIKVKA